jgi:hypothetical protein
LRLKGIGKKAMGKRESGRNSSRKKGKRKRQMKNGSGNKGTIYGLDLVKVRVRQVSLRVRIS